jgi:adenylate cyclase
VQQARLFSGLLVFAAAAKTGLVLDIINAELGAEVDEPIQVGIGLHVGPMVVGRIGLPESASITVIGKTVNAGEPLEAMTKELKCQLVVPKECANLAGYQVPTLTPKMVDVRGLTEPIKVFAVPHARDLAPKAASPLKPVAAV